MEQEIKKLLSEVVHPESGVNIVESGIAGEAVVEEDRIMLTLTFPKARDPFALGIKKRVDALLHEHYPDYKAGVVVRMGEAPKSKAAEQIDALHKNSTLTRVHNIVAVVSGKGGVGKSTVTSNLAVALRNAGYRVGVLDADIYGPSQSKMFGAEGYLPDARQENGLDIIVPAEVGGIKVMSMAMFIRPTDALLWRGTMANSALRQLIHQTDWGELDYLLIDLPPGTGDIHLSIINELHIDGAVVVSTPQQVAIADVTRSVEMLRNNNVMIPVLGVVENMAWFSPSDMPERKYYIFGRGGAARYAELAGLELLGKVPIVESVVEGGDSGRPAALTEPVIEQAFRTIAAKVVDKLR